MCAFQLTPLLQAYDAIVAIMVREEMNIHLGEPGEVWIAHAAKLFMQTHVMVVARMGQSVVTDAVQLFCAKCMAINFFYIPRLAHFIVRAVTRSTPIDTRQSEAIGARVMAAQSRSLDALSRLVPHEKRVCRRIE